MYVHYYMQLTSLHLLPRQSLVVPIRMVHLEDPIKHHKNTTELRSLRSMDIVEFIWIPLACITTNPLILLSCTIIFE